MKIKLICVGTRMPDWVEAGVAEYRKRLPADFELLITEVPLAQRGKSTDLARALEKEGEACLKIIGAKDFIIAMDVQGIMQSTEQLAGSLGKLRDSGRNIAMLVGGPDGLAPACIKAAHARWSLSSLTFPHPVVRIILAEQIYRAWSILAGHPYHRS
jgi:23S rRNA (pseudouridine1915-N3)-methyltransferase